MIILEKIKEHITQLDGKASSFQESAKKITSVCSMIGKSWSGSSFVPHAKLFFTDFKEPKVSQRFNIEWGLIYGLPDGWEEKNDEEIREKIEKDSGVSLDKLKEISVELENGFTDIQREAVLFLSENNYPGPDIEKIEKYTIQSATDIFNSIFPTKFMTRDSGAAMTGYYVVPHIYYDAIARYVSNFSNEFKGFSFELEKALSKNNLTKNSDDNRAYYVDNSRILRLSEIRSDKYDLTKLVEMCKELNDNYSLENYLSCGMILRAILDHLPPIFNKPNFKEVASNYGTKSFKDIILPLEDSARKISDLYLHNQVQKKEILPNKTQVSFQPNLDVLLSEVIRIIESE